MFRTIRTVTALAIAVLATALAPAQNPPAKPITEDQKANVLADMESIITKRAYVPGVDFAKWPDLVKKHQSEIDAAKDEFAFTNVMNEALEEFGFSHIVLFSPVAADARTNRKMVGLGIRIEPPTPGQPVKGLRIAMVFPGTPADEAGMQPGDLIVEGDGKPVKSTADLAGEEGSKVKVTVERGGKRVDFNITRRPFSTDVPETIKWVDKDTALVTIPTFDLGFRKDAVSQIMNEAMKAKNLILDLRSNGGGRVDNLLHLASYFFDATKPIGTFVNRSMAEAYAQETGKPATDAIAVAAWTKDRLRTGKPRAERFSGKVAVLVNGGTGSASEMMAAALKENMNAPLIGSKTAGAVLASQMFPIREKFMLQFPLMDYVTIKGYRIEGNGLKVDQEAPLPRAGEEDKAVSAALKLLHG